MASIKKNWQAPKMNLEGRGKEGRKEGRKQGRKDAGKAERKERRKERRKEHIPQWFANGGELRLPNPPAVV